MITFYQNDETGIYIFEHARELYKIQCGDVTKLDFKQFIREIDIKPELEPSVKREIIVNAGKIVGMLV